MIRLTLVLSMLAFALACLPTGRTDAGPNDGDAGSEDAAVDDAGPADAGSSTDAGPIHDGFPVDLDLASRCEASVFPACPVTKSLPTSVNTIIDFTDPDAVLDGRCDRENSDSMFFLPADPDAYPVLVRVSSQGFAGVCTWCGESISPYGFTTFGVAMEVSPPLSLSAAYTFVASVNAPWRVVSGGCGESCGHPCLSEYLEHLPTTCLHAYGSGFGVATDAVDPPVAEMLIELVSPRSAEVCCHLACE